MDVLEARPSLRRRVLGRGELFNPRIFDIVSAPIFGGANKGSPDTQFVSPYECDAQAPRQAIRHPARRVRSQNRTIYVHRPCSRSSGVSRASDPDTTSPEIQKKKLQPAYGVWISALWSTALCLGFRVHGLSVFASAIRLQCAISFHRTLLSCCIEDPTDPVPEKRPVSKAVISRDTKKGVFSQGDHSDALID